MKDKEKITLPPIYNTRAPAQWRIISQTIDFEDKTVLDLGCGYGDILLRCWQAGASCKGVEQELEIHNSLTGKIETMTGGYYPIPAFVVWCATIDKWISDWSSSIDRNFVFDVVICFSVLPYLANRAEVLAWIKKHSGVALIECQFAGDGPGLDFLQNDTDMLNWLRAFGWQTIEKIGETEVGGRGVSRSIWKCEG